MKYFVKELLDNCYLLYKQIQSPVAHLAVFNLCGSRHEGKYPEGIAHFTEHLLFKGTQKRKAHHILAGLENAGCDVNAYTSKEELVLHTSFLVEYSGRMSGLFSEMIFQSIFPPQEIEKERNVIIDEIATIKDNHSELICDEFEKKLFETHPLARDISGNIKSVKKTSSQQLNDFYQNSFIPSKKVIVFFGSKSFEKAEKMVRSHYVEPVQCSNFQNTSTIYPVQSRSTFQLSKKIKSHQTHVILGGKAYNMFHKDRRVLGLIINMLGGQAFNSRLNIAIREKQGLAYHIEAAYHPYTDNGYFSVYFSADNGNNLKIINTISKEFEKLRNKKTGTLQLHIAKKQLLGQTAVYLDSNANDILSAGKIFLHKQYVPTFADIRNDIENISAEDILRVSNEIFAEENINYLTYSK